MSSPAMIASNFELAWQRNERAASVVPGVGDSALLVDADGDTCHDRTADALIICTRSIR